MTPARRNGLRNLLWLYFWLLIFEGALRKWFLPGLSNPLLLLRDPLAILALSWGWPLLRQQRFLVWVKPLIIIGLLAFMLTLAVGHGDLYTALYGLRVLIVQLPLIFVFASVFDRDDVVRFAWVILWLSIPMTLLIVAQSNSPDSHFLNVGAGGIGSASFVGAAGRSRPSGTFSFISGIAAFYSLAASCLFLVLYNVSIKLPGRLLCALAGISLVVACPVSISRSVLAGYMMVIVATIAALVIARVSLTRLFGGLVALAIAVVFATMIPAFQDTSDAFLQRWESSAAVEGVERSEVGDVGIVKSQLQGRVLSGYTTPFSHIWGYPFLGRGLGMGSNVGVQRLGLQGFALGEGAWEVSFFELGMPLGLAFLIWRFNFTFFLLRSSLRSAGQGNQLPLILFGSSWLFTLQAQLTQPTGLGFVVLMGGLSLAACKVSPSNSSA